MKTLISADLYAALRAADVSDVNARAALMAVADIDRRIERPKTRLTLMRFLLGLMVAVMLGGSSRSGRSWGPMLAKLGA